MTQRLFPLLTAIAVLTLVGFGSLAWARRVDARASERYGEDLRSLLALDFRLTSEVMKARSAIVSHYDGIVQTEAARKRLHRALRNLPAFLSTQERGELGAQLDEAERVRRDSERQVERFKRENAVLRNSLRYLPVMATELEARGLDAERSVPRETIAELVRDELLLQGWSDQAVLHRVDAELSSLAGALDTAPEAERQDLRMLLTHARVVRERTPVVNNLTRAVVAGKSVGRTQALMSTFARHHRAARDRTASDSMVAFSLALLASMSGAASIIARMRRSTATLRDTAAQLERAVASLRVEQEKQRELSDLKGRFVSMTSHEFRTPLSVIISSSEMLEAYADKWPAEKKAEHFGRIRAASLGMTRMLDAILMIGRSDAGVLELNPQPLAIDRFCHDVVEAVGHATKQGARIVYRGTGSEAPVVADEALLRHVLENLLSNALKYSPEGGEIRFDALRENGELVFSVSDQGIGIPAEDQKHLFQTFHRGRNVGSISGTGLGLAIVKRAVDLHGGTLALQSEVGVGSRFTVRIPTRGEKA
jgi:signal transduction histidine kinase